MRKFALLLTLIISLPSFALIYEGKALRDQHGELQTPFFAIDHERYMIKTEGDHGMKECPITTLSYDSDHLYISYKCHCDCNNVDKYFEIKGTVNEERTQFKGKITKKAAPSNLKSSTCDDDDKDKFWGFFIANLKE